MRPRQYPRSVSQYVVREVPVATTRPLRQAVLRPHQTVDELAAHEPADAYAAFAGQEPVSVGFVGAEGGEGSWRIRGMATRPEDRGRGAGAAVLDALVSYASKQGATRIWCNARTPAIPFYERADFRVVSDEFEVPQIGPHVVMERLQAG
jgi:ribosomal protein S18 acetylase RimI-like enzyme